MSLSRKLKQHLTKRKPDQDSPVLWKQYFHLSLILIGTVGIASGYGYLMVYQGGEYLFQSVFASDTAAFLSYTVFALPAGFFIAGAIWAGLDKAYSRFF
jgi:hypothetical protein